MEEETILEGGKYIGSGRVIDGEHEFKEDIQVDIYYPNHSQRTESNLFVRTKHHLVDVLDTPCWICGSKDKREVHHFHCEWAFGNAVDWDQMKTMHPDFDWSTFKNTEDFIDSEYNMMVLCEQHHRAQDAGIHMLPYPIWIAQKFIKSGFILSEKSDNLTEDM